MARFITMKAFSIPILILLSLMSGTSQATDPTWVKNGSQYTVDGQITLKRKDGSSINLSLNQSAPSRESAGRTPNIMVVGSGGSYAWSHGFKMSDGTYYIYESELDMYVPFDEATFQSKFKYDEEDIYQINTNGLNLASSGNVELVGGFSCGNNDWASSNSCTVSNCSFNKGGSSSSGASCNAGDSWIGGEAYVTGTHSTGFYYQVNTWADVTGVFMIPNAFTDVFGKSVSASGRDSRYVGTGCSDTDGSGSTCQRVSSSSAGVSISYFFTEDWQGTALRVGGYDWSATNGANSGYYVVGDASGELPFGILNGLRLTKSGSQMFVVNGGNLYGFLPGQVPKVVMEGTTLYPVKAVNITGTKSTP